ncbi:MAG: nuclear transport factor 2 family protein [Deltaproteobacteria bacterium]|nr:nuclear transport factor 2 family protein [Deltaproteobacteria bacterium]
MNEQANLQTVQRFYQTINDGDLGATLKLIADDLDWKDAGADKEIYSWSTPVHGREEFEHYGKATFEALEFQVFQPDEFIVDRDTVVVLGHERCLVRVTGRVVEANWAQIFTLRDGLICKFREYSDTAAWEAGVVKR